MIGANPRPIDRRDRFADQLQPTPAGGVVFYSAAAQEDNLGDVVIRRNVLEWITRQCGDIHVFSGGMSNSYLAALGMPDTVTTHSSSQSFLRAWLGACGHRRASVVYAPGPRVALPNLPSTRAAVAMAAMTAITRTAGGRVLVVGGAMHGEPSPALLVHRLAAFLCSDYSVRDAESRALLGRHSRMIPDVAFADANPVEAVPSRPVLAISLRGDREIDMTVARKLVTSAIRAGVTPVVVTQVRRDQPNHERLAADLGVDLCGWTTQSHSQQLQRIESIYRRSVVVYSNRLHACVFGARNAATVIAAEPTGAGKVTSTLRAVYPCLPELPQAVSALFAVASPDFKARRIYLAVQTRLAAQKIGRERSLLAGQLRPLNISLTTMRTDSPHDEPRRMAAHE